MRVFSRSQENQRKGGRRRRIRWFVWIYGITLLSSALLLWLGWPRLVLIASHLRAAWIDHPYFSLKEIKVRGTERIGESEIMAAAGLSGGTSIWEVNLKSIEKRVEKHPWVGRVTVRRELPHRLVIEVEERIVRGIAALGKLYYVDPEGVVFKEVKEGEKVDYLFLTGLDQGDLVSRASWNRQRIQEALMLGDLLGKSLALSEIHFRPDGGVVLYPVSYPVALHMGWGDWQKKFKRLEQVWVDWRGRENRLSALDLSFRDQVVVRLKSSRDKRIKG